MREVNLTEQQAAFVAHYTGTPGAIGNAAEAARQAGYSPTSARDIGHDLLNKPHVRAAIDQANRRAISGRLYSKAVAVLERAMEDETAPLKVRVDAAKAIIDRAERNAGRPEDALQAGEGAASKPPPVDVLVELLGRAGMEVRPKGGAVVN